jgi:hypothetical protein
MGYFLKSCMFLLLCLQLSAREVVFINRTSHKPVIDGVLDDSTWLNIEPITEFVQYTPVEGVPPTESTALYITYDDNYFYLGFKCFDSDMNGVRATMTQREKWDNDDVLGFAFDPYNTQQESFLFNFNPYGIPKDFIWHYDGYIDEGWDADLRSKGIISDDHWCVEIAIPFKSLRMPAKDIQEWGFYALRVIKRRGEYDVWPSRTHKISNLLAQASILKGLEGIHTGKNLSLLPYAFFSYNNYLDQEDRPFDGGIDFRYGLTSDIMLDGTVNPDYSQIEADPDRIELTERYVQWLPEKRPFFTEGTDVFVSNQNLFYSRTITNPLLGLKLTGRVLGNRIGFLSAVDDDMNSENKIYYNHLRFKRRILGKSSIGYIMTNRDDFEDGTYNRALSMDGILNFATIYYFKPQLTRTFTRDSTGCYDATGYNLHLGRFGPHFINNIWYNDFPDEFTANSGLMWEVIGYKEIGTHHEFYIRKPFKKINEIILQGGAKGRINDGDLEEDYFWTSAETSLNSIWAKLEFFKNHEVYNDVDFKYSGCELEIWNTPVHFIDHYISIVCGSAPHYYEGFTGWKYAVFYNLTLKPISRLVLYTSISHEDFYYEFGGERSYLQTVLWNKISYQIMPQMFIRGIYQYNSLDRTSDLSFLLAFEYSPLSNIFIGTNLNDFVDVDHIGDNVEIFAKISYLWRL